MSTTVTTEGHLLHRARLYDLGTGLLGGRMRALRRSVLDLAAIRPGERVLDIGCGPGRLTMQAAEAAGSTGQTLGIDPSPEMIALATQKAHRAGSPAGFHLAAIEAIPAPDRHFDVALTSLVLHHLPPGLLERGFAEVLRVLKPGGRLVALDFAAAAGHGLGHLILLLGLARGVEHAERIKSVASAAGFEGVRIEPAASRAFRVILACKPAALV